MYQQAELREGGYDMGGGGGGEGGRVWMRRGEGGYSMGGGGGGGGEGGMKGGGGGEGRQCLPVWRHLMRRRMRSYRPAESCIPGMKGETRH